MHGHKPGRPTNARARTRTHTRIHMEKTDSVNTAPLRSAELGHASLQRAIDQILSIFDDL